MQAPGGNTRICPPKMPEMRAGFGGFPFPLLLAWPAAIFATDLLQALLSGAFFSEAALRAGTYVIFMASLVLGAVPKTFGHATNPTVEIRFVGAVGVGGHQHSTNPKGDQQIDLASARHQLRAGIYTPPVASSDRERTLSAPSWSSRRVGYWPEKQASQNCGCSSLRPASPTAR